MNLYSLRTPLVLVTVGGLMIAASFLWNRLIPIDRMIDHSRLEGLTARSNERHGIGTRRHEPISEDEDQELNADLSNDDLEELGSDRAESEREAEREGGSVERDRNPTSAVAPEEKESAKYIRRVRFLQDTAPQLARWLGVILAAAGSILYPVVLLRRAAEEAEEEEARVTD